MNRVFVTGDTHRDPQTFFNFLIDYGDNGNKLTKNDYLIICGDFGFIWNSGSLDNYWLNWIDERPWTTLFIDGNHCNFTRINSYPIIEWHGGKVHKIRDSIFHLMRGEVFTINKKTFFCFGGGLSVDKAYRIPYKSWWPEEIPNKEEYNNAIKNLELIDWAPDYIITHVMPDSYVREFYGSRYHPGDKAAYMCNDWLYQCHGYTKWYCGHYHCDIAMRPDFQICYKKIYEVM